MKDVALSANTKTLIFPADLPEAVKGILSK